MIVLILVIVLGGGMYAYKQLMPEDTEETQGPVYATKEVVKGDITVGVETTGRLNPTYGGGIRVPGERNYGGPSITYGIDEVLVEEGDEVKEGQIVAILKSDDLEIQIEEIEEKLESKRKLLSNMTGVSEDKVDGINPSDGIIINAPIGGTINNLEVEEGDKLEQGSAVARIVDDSKFKIRAKLTPAEIERVEKGQKVILDFVEFDGFNQGTITNVNENPVPDKQEDGSVEGFIYWVTIEGENPGLVQPGMEVRIGQSANGDTQAVNFFSKTSTVEEFIKEERVISRAEAIITEVFVHNMDTIEEGDPIISMAGSDTQETMEEYLEEIRELKSDLKKLKAKMDQMEVTAPMDGVISYFDLQKGDTTSPGRWIGDIFNTKEMMMSVEVDDIDIINVKQDAPVKITVDAVPGETFEGTVVHVSTRGEDVNGITKFMVEIEIKGGPSLRPGMQAKGYIDAGSAEDVLLAPVEAIFEEDGKPMVEVLGQNDKVKLVPIKLGLMNDRYAEVKSGLNEGDLVITGSSADILPSQHLKSKDPILPDKKDGDKDKDDDSENSDDSENNN